MMAIIHFLKCTVPFSFAVQLLSLAVTHCQSLSLFVTHFHSLSLVVTHCHSLPFVVTRCHSLSLVLPLVVTRCHSLSLVVPLVVTRCHSLSLAVPLVCLFIKDRKYSAQARLHCVFYCDFIHYTEINFLSKNVIFLYILKIFFTILHLKIFLEY